MIINNFNIPDAGKIFKLNNTFCFKLPADVQDYEVLDIDTDNIKIASSFAFVDNKLCVNLNAKNGIKGYLINMVFSNDDELAILLNYQASKTNEHKAKLDFLQSWRTWCGNLTNLIKNKINECHE